MIDHGDHSKAQLPLLGVILCCTSIPPEQRSDLASIACRMGAVHKLDLTSDVTHLLVGDSDTPKYKFVAKEREDVKCLLPSWVEAVRLSWMEGGETDVETLEKEHILPTLVGLRICVTGFDDLAFRKNLEDLINDNGADYRGNLTRDVTHLIAKEPCGSKYTYARQWDIKTVSIEWLQQSLERGMILDEALYNPLLPETERGRNAWIRRSTSTTSLGKRSREPALERTNSRKLRRTASARLSNEHSGLWTNIVGGGVKQEAAKADEWQEDSKQEQPVRAEGLLTKIAQTSGEQRAEEQSIDRWTSEPIKPEVTRQGLFSGKTFVLHGFDEKRTAVLHHHLQSHDARILSDLLQLLPVSRQPAGSFYLLVPHQMRTGDVPSAPTYLEQPQIATEMWIERCLLHKALVDITNHVTNAPFEKYPIHGFEKLNISVTAFQDVDLLHTSKAIKLMGAKHIEDFTPTSSVLVCNKILANSEKRISAAQWNVPTVSVEWLWDCIRKGEYLPFDDYLTQPWRPKSAIQPVDRQCSEGSNYRDTKQRQQREQPSISHNPTLRSTNKNKITDPHPSQPADTQSSSNNSTTPRPNHQDSLKSASDKTITQPSSGPLQPLSINISPKPSPTPPKPITIQASNSHRPHQPLQSYQLSKPPSQYPSPDDTLGPAISSLLAAHQRATANPPPPPQRRRRQLLGRAPSNLSARSLSRASSVDTLNTDGLGTPISGSFPPPLPKKGSDAKDPFAKLREYAEEVAQAEKGEDVQLTQLGYEDPNGRAWRERVVRKMGGEVEEMEEKVREREVVRDLVGVGRRDGVAGRTRAMGAK